MKIVSDLSLTGRPIRRASMVPRLVLDFTTGALPDAVASGEQGWLTFGETGLKLGARERIDRKVRPEPGLLVLFPSYFYHGTIPFADQRHRTTIAFDIVPAGDH